MRRAVRRWPLAVGALLLGFGCAKKEATARAQIGVTLLTEAHVFYQDLKRGMQQAADSLGMDLHIVAGEWDLARQTSQVQNFINQGMNAIVIAPVDSRGIVSAVEEANRANIPVFTADIAASGGNVVSHIASDNAQGGRLVGEYLARRLHGIGKVAILDQPTVTSVIDRVRGFREALAQSINVPAVKVLYLAGIKDSIKTAEDFGITTLGDANRYGLTLVLGGGEVTLLELTGAYGVFANDGIRNRPKGILRVEDKNGNVLEEYHEESERVIDVQIARKISDILSDNVARAPEFGTDSPLQFSEAVVADKTGTTNDYRDAWIVGYTPGIVVGAWAGNNDNAPMVKKIAAFIIAPLWHNVMAYAIQKYPSETFTPPAPENADALPPVLRGNWNSDPARGIHDILYWVDKDEPRSGRPGNPNDSQFALWEYPVSFWAGQRPFASTTPGLPLVSGSPSSLGNTFHITSPSAGASVSSLNPIVFSSYHPRPETVSRVAYYLNGVYVGASVQSPYSISLIPQTRGPTQLKATADTAEGAEESALSFTIQ